jgi:hypothetical protein
MASAEETMSSAPRRVGLERSILLLIGGMGALLALGIAIALVAAHRPEASYPPGSPQQAVATYLRLLQDGKVDQAYAMTAFREGPNGFRVPREQFNQMFGDWSSRSHRVTLLRASTKGSSATVQVEISAFSGNLFGGSDQTSRQTFTLSRRHGAWRITGPEYLYP